MIVFFNFATVTLILAAKSFRKQNTRKRMSYSKRKGNKANSDHVYSGRSFAGTSKKKKKKKKR